MPDATKPAARSYRVITPEDGPLYDALAAIDRRIEAALRPYRGHPACEAHYAIADRMARECEEDARADAEKGDRHAA